jgi:hypothetical protein
MEHYDKGIINVNKPHRKKIVVKPKIYQSFILSFTLPSMLVALIFVASASTYPVHATGANYETEATTLAPGGTPVGSAGSGTNVSQSDCLPQNATTRGSSVVDTGGARATTTNDTTITFAPSGASIAANDTSTSNATAGNTVTTNDTTITFAPSGAGVC